MSKIWTALKAIEGTPLFGSIENAVLTAIINGTGVQGVVANLEALLAQQTVPEVVDAIKSIIDVVLAHPA
jgi:hypothetical protein